MKSALKILILLLIVVLITGTVTSDKLDFEYDSNDSEIIVHFGSIADPDSIESIEIELMTIVVLFSIGLIGIVSFARVKKRENDDDNTYR